MIQISDTALAEGDIELWFNWLRAGIIAYARDEPTATRYRAFSPLVVDPQSANPAGDIVEQIRTIPVQRSGVAEAAAIEALCHWSLSCDGWEAGALLISVAGRLGGRGLPDAIWGLVARSGELPADARAELAYVAVEIAKLRYRYSEVVSLFELLWAEELATPQLVAALALLLSRKDHGGLKMMPTKLAKIMPSLVEPPHSGDFVRVIAAALRQSYGVEDLKALLPIDNEEPKIADFRRVLLHLSRPDNVYRMQLTDASRNRIAQRLANLATFGASNELNELPFPDAASNVTPKGSEQP